MTVAFLPTHSTYGRALAQRDFGGFALSLGLHRAGEVVPAHRHEDAYQWCMTLNGGFEETSGARREFCGSGSLLIRPPDCVHADRFSATQGVCLNLFPQRVWLDAYEFEAFADTYHHHRAPRLLALAKDIAGELRTSDAASPLAIEALMVEALSTASRLEQYRRSGHAHWLALALDAIEANPAGALRLGDLARAAGVSAGHLARAFRATFGKSAGAYVRERRLTRAAAMMRSSAESLADIATATGFYDQAHFTRAFRLRFGVTPIAYRQSARP